MSHSPIYRTSTLPLGHIETAILPRNLNKALSSISVLKALKAKALRDLLLHVRTVGDYFYAVKADIVRMKLALIFIV